MDYKIRHVPDHVLQRTIEQLETYGKFLKTIEDAGFYADSRQAFGIGLLPTINILRQISDRPTISELG